MAYTDFHVQGDVTLNAKYEDVKSVTRYPLASSSEEAIQKFTDYCQGRIGDLLMSVQIDFATEMSR